MEEFKLELRKIKKKEETVYYACVMYVGDDPEFRYAIEQMKEETFFYEQEESSEYSTDDLCVFNAVLSANRYNKIQGTYYMENSEEEEPDTLTWQAVSNCHLSAFYNNTLNNKLKNFSQTKKLKGVGHFILCLIINDILTNNILAPDQYITLEASGYIKGKEKQGLVRYYESIGFRQIFPNLLDIGLDQSNVPMRARLIDVLDKCENVSISSDIKQVEKVINLNKM
jgi:hypothetical protein